MQKNKKSKTLKMILITLATLLLVTIVVLVGKLSLSDDTKNSDNINPTKTPDKIESSTQQPTKQPSNQPTQQPSTQPTKTPLQDAEIEEEEDATNNLGYGIQLEKIGSYTGMYMEDGSDTFVSGVTMVMVSNVGEDYIQYAEVVVSNGEKEAQFSFSTLYPGQTIVMLEKNKLPYDEIKSGSVNAIMENTILFTEKPEAHEDVLKIQPLDGAFNVTNISDKDITEDIMIYYKNSVNDVLYGGITYRGTITGGIKAGEIKQVMSQHFTKDGSKVMFVTWG